MLIHETYISMGSNGFSYGYTFKEAEGMDDSVFDIEIEAVPDNKFSEQAVAESDRRLGSELVWLADAFANAVKKSGTLIGFQIAKQDGEYWEDHCSFEVLGPDLAAQHLIDAKNEGANVTLQAIYAGDIESPLAVGQIDGVPFETKVILD